MVDHGRTLHLINPLENPSGGSEQRCLRLYELLSPHARVKLWSNGRVDAGIAARYPVRPLGEEGPAPDGGTVVFIGWYKPPGSWLESLRADRTIMVFNTPGVRLLELACTELSARGHMPELVFASRWLQEASGRQGIVEQSPLDIQRFRPVSDQDAGLQPGGFCVGRLSRDVGGKHHPDDARLYQAMASKGLQVRLMGATVLRPILQRRPVSGIEILPEAAQPAEHFLRTLDCFYYRTNDEWREPSGRVVFEAMATALPVVVHRQVGAAELITHGENGFLFDTMEQAFAFIMRLSIDHELRYRIGEAARATVERWHGPEAVAHVVEFYAR